LTAGIYLAGITGTFACRKTNNVVTPTKVSLIQSSDLREATGSFNRLKICEMLDQGIKAITGYDSPDKAWNSLFFSNDVVALKANCIGRQTGSTKPDLCYAIAECLNKYVAIPHENVIVFDRTDIELEEAGYTINKSDKGLQIYSTPAYSTPFTVDHVLMGVSSIITKTCTALINVPLLKTHRSAGITLNLKNHYGSIPTETVKDSKYKFHSDGKYENTVRVNTLPPIKDKQRLCIADGLIAQYKDGPRGNPQYQWPFNGIIMGEDPVAVDRIGLKIINEQKIKKNLKPTVINYLKWAADEGIGNNDLNHIELVHCKI
jgi:uncharacterized protein (DUF362 family)